MIFTGKIQGVQLYESSAPSSARIVGHMNGVAHTHTMEANRNEIQNLVAMYGVDDKEVVVQIGNGEDL